MELIKRFQAFNIFMELIIIVFIKLMGAAISGHWACDTQELRETMTLLCGLLGGSVSVYTLQ